MVMVRVRVRIRPTTSSRARVRVKVKVRARIKKYRTYHFQSTLLLFHIHSPLSFVWLSASI
jgi:hypothetical protein